MAASRLAESVRVAALGVMQLLMGLSTAKIGVALAGYYASEGVLGAVFNYADGGDHASAHHNALVARRLQRSKGTALQAALGCSAWRPRFRRWLPTGRS